jgi:hypothetical protein
VSKSKPSKKRAEAFGNLSLPPAPVGLLFDPEDGDDMFLRNFRITPNYMAFRTLHFIILFIRPEIDRSLNSDLNPGAGTATSRCPPCSRIFTPSFSYLHAV